MTKIVTHDSKFHTDDVFAVATLFLVLGKENCSVVRTRDDKDISTADYVVDVGSVYDVENNRFDHHQLGGAGARDNGIPFASFGLVWKKFGKELCGSDGVFEELDRMLVQSIDAIDNGQNISKPLIPDVYSFDVNNLVNLYRATWKEEGNWNVRFLDCVDWAMTVISRLISVTKDWEESRKVAVSAYESSKDKRVVILDKEYDIGREAVMSALSSYPEPVYAVLYRSDASNWQVVAMRKSAETFESKKPLPENWRAKREVELKEVTGFDDVVFCHGTGFMCVAKSKETAIALAEKALKA